MGRVSRTPRSVVVTQVAMGDYRQAFLDELDGLVGGGGPGRITFLAGEQYFEPSVRTAVRSERVVVADRNRFALGRRVVWQRGVVGPSVRADVAVVELNPRILSTWAIVGARKALGRPTLAWGHAWGRSGRASGTAPVRRALRSLADGLVLYTESEQRELREAGCRAPTWVATNSLYRAREMRVPTCDRVGDGPHDVLVVGRLVAAKKVDQVLRAFRVALPRLPADSRLVVVGDGPERGRLEGLAELLGIADRTVFTGHDADPDRLAARYASAACSVSAGYVGLSLIQSLGFGVPMVYARDEPHAPEIEAADPTNSVCVPSGDLDAMADALVALCRDDADPAERAHTRERIAAACRETYSATAMARAFVSAVTEVAA